MPAATEAPAAKKERDELLWQALKEHIMRERQKKKEGLLIAKLNFQNFHSKKFHLMRFDLFYD